MSRPSPAVVVASAVGTALTGVAFAVYRHVTRTRHRRDLARASAEAYVAGVRDTHAELGDRLGELIDEQT